MKRSLHNLAICGGSPTFEDERHVGRPNIGDRALFLARVNDLLDRRWLTNGGPYVEELEGRIAELHEVNHCVVTCNGTVALELSIRALELHGEVIVPAFTFVATAHALQWHGITPVFCDVDPRTHNLDPRRVEELITPRTTAILPVHLWGRPCDVEGLRAIVAQHGLKLIYDAAHAFGCSAGGRMIGAFGNAEVLSFHATKFFNTLEGGAVLTNDDGLAHRLRLQKNFGFADYDRVVELGVNAKMNEISAAMGLTLLDSLDELIALNYRRYCQYQARLGGLPGMRLVCYDDHGQQSERRNYQYVVLEIDRAEAGISRDTLLRVLWAEKVLARRYFYPGVHRMEPYCSRYPDPSARLPVSERLSDQLLSLPTGTGVTAEDVDLICDIIATAITHGAELERLEAKRPQRNLRP